MKDKNFHFNQNSANPGSKPASQASNIPADDASAASLALAEAKITELTGDLQRTRADFENYRKQIELQREQTKKAVEEATVVKLLPLLDDLDRAIATYPELSPLAKSLAKSLKDLRLTKIPSDPGTDFNPDLHDAVMVEGDGTHEVVAETLRPGYFYGGEVLRPAMVKVKAE